MQMIHPDDEARLQKSSQIQIQVKDIYKKKLWVHKFFGEEHAA